MSARHNDVAQDALRSIDVLSEGERERARSIERAARSLRASIDANMDN